MRARTRKRKEKGKGKRERKSTTVRAILFLNRRAKIKNPRTIQVRVV
jgi:hypothetical protein